MPRLCRIRLRFAPGVSALIRTRLMYLARWFEVTQNVEHEISVSVGPDSYVISDPSDREYRDRQGCFSYPTKREPGRIKVAGRQSIQEASLTLLHELVHYDRWRLGKTHGEVRVEREAVKLLIQAMR